MPVRRCSSPAAKYPLEGVSPSAYRVPVLWPYWSTLTLCYGSKPGHQEHSETALAIAAQAVRLRVPGGLGVSDDFASPRDRDQTIYITWDDAGRIAAPGRVNVKGRSFQVEQMHMDVWQDQPRGGPGAGGKSEPTTQWVLSSFYQTRDNV